MLPDLNDLKKQNFFRMLELAGRVFIHVRHSEDVALGKRGFLDEEKEKGLTLVFNRSMNFEWNENGISATLVFGTRPEKCFIPLHEILSVFSPELNAQFLVYPKTTEALKPHKSDQNKKIIQVDFKKK